MNLLRDCHSNQSLNDPCTLVVKPTRCLLRRISEPTIKEYYLAVGGETKTMSTITTRDQILEALQDLPPDATLEDAMEKLVFLSKIERGLKESEEGKTIPHAEVKARFARG